MISVFSSRFAFIAALIILSCSNMVAAATQYEKFMLEGAQQAALKKREEAVANYSRAISAKPDDSKAYLKRAFQYCCMKKFAAAKADYDSAIRIEPKNPMIYRERGCMLGSTHKFEEAIKDFSKSIELNPKISTPYLDRARAYQALGQPEKARKDLDQALKFYSGKENIGVKNKSIYFTYGNGQKQDPSQKKLARLGKGLFVALRGNLSGASGDLDEALMDMNESKRLIQKRPDRHSVKQSFKQREKVEKLITSYSQLIYLNPKDIDSFYNRGIVYVSLKQWDEATSNFQRVVELSKWNGKAPVQASIWRYIGLSKLKRTTEARKVLNEALLQCKDKGWPQPILSYISGAKSKSDLLKTAAGRDQETQARCVVGMVEEINGHKGEDLKQFEWIEKNGDFTLDEFVIALNELN